MGCLLFPVELAPRCFAQLPGSVLQALFVLAYPRQPAGFLGCCGFHLGFPCGGCPDNPGTKSGSRFVILGHADHLWRSASARTGEPLISREAQGLARPW